MGNRLNSHCVSALVEIHARIVLQGMVLILVVIMCRHEAAQSLTLTVISKKAGREKQFSMATLDVQQLIALIKSQSTGKL